MNPAIIIIDMLKDSIERQPSSELAYEAQKVIPRLQVLLNLARTLGLPVVFACDSYREDDFIFEGKGKPICLEGTEGAEIIEALRPLENEIIVRKRRFSAFFRTDLDLLLKRKNVDTIILSGITTQFCVLATAFDGVQSDFSVILVEDCIASHREDLHRIIMEIYRATILYPLLRVTKLNLVTEEIRMNCARNHQ